MGLVNWAGTVAAPPRSTEAPASSPVAEFAVGGMAQDKRFFFFLSFCVFVSPLFKPAVRSGRVEKALRGAGPIGNPDGRHD